MHQVSYVRGERAITARHNTVAATNLKSSLTCVWVAVNIGSLAFEAVTKVSFVACSSPLREGKRHRIVSAWGRYLSSLCDSVRP